MEFNYEFSEREVKDETAKWWNLITQNFIGAESRLECLVPLCQGQVSFITITVLGLPSGSSFSGAWGQNLAWFCSFGEGRAETVRLTVKIYAC